MFFDRFFKSRRLDAKVRQWLSKQSYPDDAILYLIEKELYEHGERDLGFVIPRKRNDAYFAELLDKERHDGRPRSNMAFYDSAWGASGDKSEPATVHKPVKKPHKPAVKTIEKVGTIPASSSRKTTLASINKGRKIYHTTSSAVVITPPEEAYDDHDVDLTCFDD